MVKYHHPAVPTEAQLKWALLHTRRQEQRMLSHEDTEVLNESQSEYTERHNSIRENGYQHDLSQEEIHARQRRKIRMNECYAFGRQFTPARRGRLEDDPARTTRFQHAFAAAVAAVEQNQQPKAHDGMVPSKLQHDYETPQKTTAVSSPVRLVWTPAVRDQVASAAKSVLPAEEEVHSFVRQFEAFLLDDENGICDDSSWTLDTTSTGGFEPAMYCDTSTSCNHANTGSFLIKDEQTLLPRQPRTSESSSSSSVGCGLSVVRGSYIPPDQFGNARWERQMMP